MQNLFSREPAVIIGIIAAAILAVVSSLQGNGVISADLGEVISNALNPAGGWAIPIIVGIVTRFAVYAPATVERIKSGGQE